MLLKLAWRNIWRNKRRSLIVLLSVVVGVVAIIISDGLSNGMMRQMLFNQISSSISHIQIHKKGFRDNKLVKNYLPDYKHVESVLKTEPLVKSFSERVITSGLLSSANNSSGVMIYGVHPNEEAKVSKIKSSIIEGKYFGDGSRSIVIGKKLAEKLGVEVGDKVVAMSTSLSGEMGSELFRVSGIFRTFSSDFDKTTIYIPIQTAQKMLGLGNKIDEFAIILDNYKEAPQVKKQLLSKLNNDKYEVFTYGDLLPMLILQMDIYNETMFILNLIIGLALVFGIINTMLMAVYERIREFGVLMSIGMKNKKIITMILSEAFILGVIGSILGLLIGLLIQIPLSKSGIDLSFFAEGLESFGAGAIIYPVLSIQNLINTIIFMPFVAVIGAIYPAYKAIKLEPVYAIRYV